METAGYEGHFASARRPYPWKAGKYSYSLRRLDTQMANGQPFTWVGAFVHEDATGREIFVGALRFPGDKLKNSGGNTAFMEFGGVPAGADGVQNGVDRLFGVEIGPGIGAHALEMRGVLLQISQQGDF